MVDGVELDPGSAKFVSQVLGEPAFAGARVPDD
jgi:hypothetical protein